MDWLNYHHLRHFWMIARHGSMTRAAAALIHTDLGTGDHEANMAMGKWLGPALDTLAGTGGGADQMARLMQGIIVKHKLMKQSLIVVNKSGGAGAEGARRGELCHCRHRHHGSSCRHAAGQ